MRITRLVSSALLPAALLASLVLAPAALAGEPATVTVRVEGFEGATLLPQTTVTTTTTPVPVEGGTCSGTSAGGALYDAVHGDWVARNTGGVQIDGIDGVDLPPFGPGNYAFWAVWLSNTYAEHGACEEALSPGERVVFAAQCFEIGPFCPSNANAPEHFLTATEPSPSTVVLGEPVSLKIGSLSTASGEAEATLPAGVSVSDGTTSVAPDASGTATFSFAQAGSYTLQARGPSSIPSDPFTVCVHNPGESGCGTSPQTPAGGVAGFKSEEAAVPYRGPYALVAHPSEPLDSHFYTAGKAPREISGTILEHSAVNSVSIELHRSYRGRCFAFDASRARFVHARCGSGIFFQVSKAASYSYLLPAALPPGRYVLDVKATDVAGNTTTLVRGTSRSVFYVG